MATKGLTNKEQRFAKAAAAGASQAAAYAAAYSAQGSTATQRANGHRIAKKPHVAEEIQRLRRLPAIDDYVNIKKEMILRLLDIAENGKNSVAQHRAILTLLQYSEKGVERQPAEAPVPSIEQLLKELRADIEVESFEDLIAQVNRMGTHVCKKPPAQAESVHIEDDYGLVPDKALQPRLVNTAEARAEAYRVTREAEIRAHQQHVERSRAEVQRLTELYRQQQQNAAGSPMSEQANEKGHVGDKDPDSSIADTSSAVPRAYVQTSGPRPGYRREMIPGRFPPQFRWVTIIEEEED
jgi:hypothetical protein